MVYASNSSFIKCGTKRGLPISCFLNEASDSLNGILDLWSENVWLAAKGGGIGSYWGNLRSMEKNWLKLERHQE